jgi:hypothetical protein
MSFIAPAVRPPAYLPLEALKDVISCAFQRLFGFRRRCQHPCPSFPIAGQQSCPVCDAWRDYVFSPRWQNEYTQLLAEYRLGYLSRESFAAEVHERLSASAGVFVGEWREGGR